MASSDNDSGSECFESADENLTDDESDSKKLVATQQVEADVNKNIKNDETSSDKNDDVNVEECNSSNKNIQYRKRPERVKSSPKKTQFVESSKLFPKIEPIKIELPKPDAIIHDISNQITKNLNIGLSSIHQTSSSIKDLVFSSFPSTNQVSQNEVAFTYEERDDSKLDESSKGNSSFKLPSSNQAPENEVAFTYEEQDDSKLDESSKGNSSFDEMMSDIVQEFKELESIVKNKARGTVIEDKDDKDALDVGFHLEDCEIESENNELRFSDVNADETAENSSKGDHLKMDELQDDVNDKGDAKYITERDYGKDVSAENDSNVKDDEKLLTVLKTQLETENDSKKVEPVPDINTVKESINEESGWNDLEMDLELEEVNNKVDSVLEEVNNENIPVVEEPTDRNTSVHEEANVEVLSVLNSEPEETNGIINSQLEKLNSSSDKDSLHLHNDNIPRPEDELEENEGWDDFNIDDEELDVIKNEPEQVAPTKAKEVTSTTEDDSWDHDWGKDDQKWSGWDDFGKKSEKPSWGLSNWGMSTILNTASAVTGNLTAVTQGISSALENSLGVPDPETLARTQKQEEKSTPRNINQESKNSLPSDNPGNIFPVFGITNLVAGVTSKIVEHTKVTEIGSKVISGGLDTLENIGKKTMEVLQEGDPGLKKKRAMLLGDDKPILSQMLREAKERAEKEDRKLEERQAARRCHFETLFDDFQGLVHLEALEMLSTQCELKLDQMKSSLSAEECEELIGILTEVKELCDIDEAEFEVDSATMVDFKKALTEATEPIKNEISIQKMIDIHERAEEWFKSESTKELTPRMVYPKAMSLMAELTAAAAHQFHKGGELLLIKERRKTVEEADVLLRLTSLLCSEINVLSKKFLTLLTENKKKHSNMKDIDLVMKNIDQESKNAISYIKQAFILLIPVVQLGAT